MFTLWITSKNDNLIVWWRDPKSLSEEKKPVATYSATKSLQKLEQKTMQEEMQRPNSIKLDFSQMPIK